MSTITPERTYEADRSPEQVELDAEVLARVKRGLALLEEKHGPGWEDKINMRSLDLQWGTYCVLGQVYGDYGEGCGVLCIDRYDPLFGFTLAKESYSQEVYAQWSARRGAAWRELQRCWEHVLTPRVNQGS